MSRNIDEPLAALSSRRSACRSRVLVTLDDTGRPMFPKELGDACGMDAYRLHAVLFGDDVDFSVARSPISLGQVAILQMSEGDLIALTAAGRAEAARLRREAFWERGRARRRPLLDNG